MFEKDTNPSINNKDNNSCDTQYFGWFYRLGLWLAITWFMFVNIVFYWHLFSQREGEIVQVWHRLLELFH